MDIPLLMLQPDSPTQLGQTSQIGESCPRTRQVWPMAGRRSLQPMPMLMLNAHGGRKRLADYCRGRWHGHARPERCKSCVTCAMMSPVAAAPHPCSHGAELQSAGLRQEPKAKIAGQRRLPPSRRHLVPQRSVSGRIRLPRLGWAAALIVPLSLFLLALALPI